MSFTTSAFWLSLYMQNVFKFSALKVAVHLLPQAIGGIIVNIIAALVLHRVNNKILTGIGALAYLCSAILLATMKQESSYWGFIFPALLLSVIGADLQFNVANVSSSPPDLISLNISRCMLCRLFHPVNNHLLEVSSIQLPKFAPPLVLASQQVSTMPSRRVKQHCKRPSDPTIWCFGSA